MKKAAAILLSAALLFSAVPAYAAQDQSSAPEKPALIISGSEIVSGKGFLKNTIWLTGSELDEIADSADAETTEKYGLGDSFAGPVTYSTFENHGVPVWQYRCVSGLDLKKLADYLGIDTAKKMSITVTSYDGMVKTLSDAFSYETKRYSFGTDGVSYADAGPMLALFESSSATSELGTGVLPEPPYAGKDSPDRTEPTFAFGQIDTDEITNCFWVKGVIRVRFGGESPALKIIDAGGTEISNSLSAIISTGIYNESFGDVSAVGVPMSEVLSANKIKINDIKELKAEADGGDTLVISDVSDAFLAWDAAENGKAVENNTALRIYTKSGKCLADLRSLTVVNKEPYEEQFIDMENYGWADEAVNALYRDGIVKGVEKDKFSPGTDIKRGDLILMLDRAFKFEDVRDSGFSDVPETSYYAEAIARAKSLGIAKGDGKKFYPENKVTRQEAMTLIARILDVYDHDIKASADLSEFADNADIAGWARPSVEALVGAGIINGKGGCIAPEDSLTRAEMAVSLYRTLNYIK